MCICLPNGKFTFRFSRSYPCIGKKDSKHKHNLTLIEESSEEEEIHNKPIVSNGNGVKKDGHKMTQNVNHQQGHYRQLSRDRQLPPVPDYNDFAATQANSSRKPSLKQKNKNNDSGNSNQDPSRQNIEEYGSIGESETYGESRSNAQSPTSANTAPFKLITSDEIRDVDPLYASVIPQMKRCEIKDKPSNSQCCDNDKFLINHLNDHGYSIIMKKSAINDFNSLRKPDRAKPIPKEPCHQSLQSLNNQAPGLPIRQYKQSELMHIMNNDRYNDPEIKMRDNKPLYNGSNSIRRFSQPPNITKQLSYSSYDDNVNIQEQDVLKSLQSTYNTPPIKRASLTNLCQIDSHDSNSNFNDWSASREDNREGINNREVLSNRDDSDLYRRITVRESLASLRERNALPSENTDLSYTPTTTVAAGGHHVYEGLYETLYYSSADNGRNGQSIENARARPPILPPIDNPLQYLGQDNYLSITENPLADNFQPNVVLAVKTESGCSRPVQNDRSSVVYTAAGSDVYAEISDIYQTKQYEELPETKQIVKCEGGQVNNGFNECSSPGSVRVLLEIQSFRHMDSDVDISSRCTTPLHPFSKSIINGNNNKPMSWKATESTDFHMGIIRHPWYLPQKTPLVSSQNFPNKSSLSSSTSLMNKTQIVKPKIPQNNLAIMTPLMERSMEGSTMFLDENKNNSQSGIDSLYDLFKQEKLTNNNNCPINVCCNELSLVNQFLHDNSSPDDNMFSSPAIVNGKTKKIIYPKFSGTDRHC